jgi:hypothetical protein
MQPHRVLCVVLALAAATTVAAQDLPYAGTWKMNPAKSDFGQTTMTIEQLPSGEMQATAAGQTYRFKLDGKDYPAFFGATAAWTTLGPASWQTVWRLNGKVLSTDTLTLSADGKTLTIHSKGTKPNGEMLDDTIVSERVSGGPGLSGKWKTKNLKSSSPSVLEFAASGSDGLILRIVDMELSCEARFDGKDHPCTGPTIGPGWTIAVAKQGARGLDMTVKNNGKTVFKTSYSVSADGKTLTEHGTAAGTNEKTTVVYDRQSVP